MKIRKLITPAVVAIALISSGMNSAHAAKRAKPVTSISCTSVTDVAGLKNVLYKNENIHGGRGRTFLDQDHQLGGTRKLYVAGMNGAVFSCFGLYRCDRPYGCRYYQAMCGDRVSNRSFIKKARSNGDHNILVGKKKGPCFKIDSTAYRYGSVRK